MSRQYLWEKRRSWNMFCCALCGRDLYRISTARSRNGPKSPGGLFLYVIRGVDKQRIDTYSGTGGAGSKAALTGANPRVTTTSPSGGR